MHARLLPLCLAAFLAACGAEEPPKPAPAPEPEPVLEQRPQLGAEQFRELMEKYRREMEGERVPVAEAGPPAQPAKPPPRPSGLPAGRGPFGRPARGGETPGSADDIPGGGGWCGTGRLAGPFAGPSEGPLPGKGLLPRVGVWEGPDAEGVWVKRTPSLVRPEDAKDTDPRVGWRWGYEERFGFTIDGHFHISLPGETREDFLVRVTQPIAQPRAKPAERPGKKTGK